MRVYTHEVDLEQKLDEYPDPSGKPATVIK
jgi:hypothetical protein